MRLCLIAPSLLGIMFLASSGCQRMSDKLDVRHGSSESMEIQNDATKVDLGKVPLSERKPGPTQEGQRSTDSKRARKETELQIQIPDQQFLDKGNDSANSQTDEKDPVYKEKSLQEWIEALSDPYPKARLEAAQALAAMGPKAKKAVIPLTDVLKKSNDRALSGAAVAALGRIGKDAIPGLSQLLRSEKNDARYSAVKALALIGQDAVPALIDALKTSELRLVAMDALGKLGPSAKEAVPELIRLLNVSEFFEAQNIAAVLGVIGSDASEAVQPIIKAMEVERNKSGNPWKFADALAKMGKDGRNALIDGLKHKDRFIRYESVRAISTVGVSAKDAVPALIEAFKDEDKHIHKLVILAFGKIGPDAKAAVPSLIEATKDQDKTVRLQAIVAIGEIGPNAKPAVDELISALKDADFSIRAYSASALGKIGPDAKDAVGQLVKSLLDVSPLVRRASASALGKIGPEAKAAVKPLIKAFQLDEDPVVRKSSADSLKAIDPEAAKKAGVNVP